MPISLKQHFDMFAHYNQWANERLYQAAGALSDTDYRADRGTFFKSIHGTLNHLLVTDRIWRQRLNGQGKATDSLDTILYEDFPALYEARKIEDERIVSYVASLTESGLSDVITYLPVSTTELKTQVVAPALAHWFNHQTHHRGQVHAMLTGLTGNAPELDLLFYQRLSK
ncbi:MAG TPA: DinB family protein [Herbaspirillum sp.]|jgi:uncharacterized damage-inducible protein DinB|nr:DinB family protein [Herbaspirillum sp.]